MKIPIGPVKKPLWVTVAIVDAKIPMLLGNNILKPHEAEIKLFSTGGGVLILKDEEIALVEMDAGHYTSFLNLPRIRGIYLCKSILNQSIK